MPPQSAHIWLLSARRLSYEGAVKKPGLLLRNSISIRKAGDELADVRGIPERNAVAHRGPTLQEAFVQTWTMTDISTGWTEYLSIRNNASKLILQAVEELREAYPFPVTGFDSDNGTEFRNHGVADWLLAHDRAFIRSRPCKKNDQAALESKNNHVVPKHAFYWRYDRIDESELFSQLWSLMSLRLNFFTPTKKPIGLTETTGGRRRCVHGTPETLWLLVKRSEIPVDVVLIEQRTAGTNPAAITRIIATVQQSFTNLAREKTGETTSIRQLEVAS